MDVPAPWKAPRPWPLPLLGPRVRVDLWRPADAPALWQAIEESRGGLLPWMPWALTKHRDPDDTLADIEAWTRKHSAPEPDELFLGIFDRASGAVLGGTGFHRIVEEWGQAEVGYWMHVGHRGRGLGTEALRTVLSAAFGPFRFRRIVVQCAGANRASQRVAEKAGLPLEARERLARWVEGVGWDDSLSYGLLAEEWDAARDAPKAAQAARLA